MIMSKTFVSRNEGLLNYTSEIYSNLLESLEIILCQWSMEESKKDPRNQTLKLNYYIISENSIVV